MRQLFTSIIAVSLSGVAACATASDGTKPHDMSLEGHEAAAVHWLSAANPSQQDRAKYEKAHALAAQHRAAARALVDAEAGACVGVAIDDRDISPFARRQDIESVSEVVYRDTVQADSVISPVLRGAAIKFRPVPGLTRERLQRIIDCHAARNASLGYPAEIPCPLALRGANAVVTESGGALTVEITSQNFPLATEILARSSRLGPPRAPPQIDLGPSAFKDTL